MGICISRGRGKYNSYMRTGNQHNQWLVKLCLAGALFVALTAVKLLLPAQTAQMRAQLREAISRDTDYMAVFARLGERMAGGEDAVEALSRLALGADGLAPAGTPEPQRGETDGADAQGAPDDAAEDEPAEESAPVESAQIESEPPEESVLPEESAGPAESEPEPTETPAAVAAFLESQAEFADYALPASVTYEMPELPFDYVSPVEGYTSSGFGYRLHPLEGEVKFHYGTDFAAWTGTDILAFADGTVGMAGWDAGFGNYLIINHADGWRTLYAHCSKLLVAAGESVTKGQRVALVGGTGQVTGPHLHLELTCDGLYYNPEFYLA